jgi:hypothetical protein
MSTTVKSIGLVVLSVLLLGAAFVVGRVTAPATSEAGMDHGAMTQESAAPASELPAEGVFVAQDGYELELLSGGAAAGEQENFAFQIVGKGGKPVTKFTPTHDEPMHLIVARWDLTGFQHVHPKLNDDGVWQIPLTFEGGGDYRAYADFAPDGRPDAMTLATNIAVSGSYTPAPLPQPSNRWSADGYTVELTGKLVAGDSSMLTLTVSRDGKAVTDLQPYLAAYGHLVALRDGDLAYLHVHPDGEPGDGKTKPGPAIVFHVEAPSAGDYRLFLNFKHQGTVRTADFTLRADAG